MKMGLDNLSFSKDKREKVNERQIKTTQIYVRRFILPSLLKKVDRQLHKGPHHLRIYDEYLMKIKEEREKERKRINIEIFRPLSTA